MHPIFENIENIRYMDMPMYHYAKTHKGILRSVCWCLDWETEWFLEFIKKDTPHNDFNKKLRKLIKDIFSALNMHTSKEKINSGFIKGTGEIDWQRTMFGSRVIEPKR